MSTAERANVKKIIQFGEAELGLEPDNPMYVQGMACVRSYWSYATRMDFCQQEEMVKYIQNFDYYMPNAYEKYMSQHKLYKMTMEAYRSRGSEGLSWPIYLILTSIFNRRPAEYIKVMHERFGERLRNYRNHEQEYLKAIRDSKNILIDIAGDEPAAATNATPTQAADSETEKQVIVVVPAPNPERAAALAGLKRSRGSSDDAGTEPKRTRPSSSIEDFRGNPIDMSNPMSAGLESRRGFRLINPPEHASPIVGGNSIGANLRSRRILQSFDNENDLDDFASPGMERPLMTDNDFLTMMADVRAAKQISQRNEARITAMNARLDVFISEMRRLMTALADATGVLLPTEGMGDGNYQ